PHTDVDRAGAAALGEIVAEDGSEALVRDAFEQLPKLLRCDSVHTARPAWVEAMVFQLGGVPNGAGPAQIDHSSDVEWPAVPHQMRSARAIVLRNGTNVVARVGVDARDADVAVLHARQVVHGELHGRTPIDGPPPGRPMHPGGRRRRAAGGNDPPWYRCRDGPSAPRRERG